MEMALPLVVRINDLLHSHVGSCQEADKAQGSDGEIFEEEERSGRLAGMRDELHQRRKDERQRWAAHRTDQWDHQVQARYHDGCYTWESEREIK